MRFSLENLNKFVVLTVWMHKPRCCNLSFPTSQLWHPTPLARSPRVNTSSRRCPHVTALSCAVFIVVVRSSQSAKLVKHVRQTAKLLKIGARTSVGTDNNAVMFKIFRTQTVGSPCVLARWQFSWCGQGVPLLFPASADVIKYFFN
jgi:hypothetical protein